MHTGRGRLRRSRGLPSAATLALAGTLDLPTAEMAPFMIALLQDGRFGKAQILEMDTAQLMKRQQFTHHPELPGLCYGLEERYVNGLRVIGKGGDDMAYSSQMILLPEHNWGFYVVHNAQTNGLRDDLVDAFLDRYYPAERDSSRQPLSLPGDDLRRFNGHYRYTRYSHTTLEKLLGLPFFVSIRANDDGDLSMRILGVGAESRYTPVEPLAFQRTVGGPVSILGLQIDLGDALVFRQDAVGRSTYVFIPALSFALEKLPWYERGDVQLGLLGGMLVVLLSASVGWSLAWILARLRKRPSSGTPGHSRARWLAGLTSGLNTLFVVGFCFALFTGGLAYGVSPLIKVLLAILVLTSLMAVIMIGMAVVAWRVGYWSRLGRIHFSLVTLAAQPLSGGPTPGTCWAGSMAWDEMKGSCIRAASASQTGSPRGGSNAG
jgi:hypothetical protein